MNNLFNLKPPLTADSRGYEVGLYNVIARGRTFESETDTEVVAHLVSEEVEAGKSPVDAVKAVLPKLRGAFALAIAFRQHPDMLIGARLGSPLVVGYGEGETYLGSDALALAPLTQRITYLEEGDWVVITRDGAKIFDKDNNPVEREIVASGASALLRVARSRCSSWSNSSLMSAARNACSGLVAQASRKSSPCSAVFSCRPTV